MPSVTVLAVFASAGCNVACHNIPHKLRGWGKGAKYTARKPPLVLAARQGQCDVSGQDLQPHCGCAFRQRSRMCLRVYLGHQGPNGHLSSQF